MKKLLSLLLCMSLLFSCCVIGFGTAASALEASPESDFIAFDGVIEDYVGAGGVVVIPAEIDGEPIYEIADYTFSANEDITEVYISEGIEKIGYRAFYQCPNLSKIELPYSVNYAGSNAFAQTALTEITIPGKLEILQFGLCSENHFLSEINISYGVKEILGSCFNTSQPCDVVIPESVEIVCGFTFAFPKGKEASRTITICNPNAQIGVHTETAVGPNNYLKHEWAGDPIAIAYSAEDGDAVTTYIFPEGSESGKTAETYFQKDLDSTKGTSCDVSNNKQVVQYKPQSYFDELKENQENFGITQTRADLTFTSGSDGSTPGVTDPGAPNNGTTNPGTTNPGTTTPGTTNPGTTTPGTTEPGTTTPGTTNSGTGNNTNKNDGGSITTVYEEENSLGTVLMIIGIVFGVLIIGVVVVAAIMLKKKAPAEEIAEEEAVADETPAEDAE